MLRLSTLSNFLNKSLPMHIRQHNQRQKCLDDIDNPNYKNHHISPKYCLFPSNQILAYCTPELFEASKNSLIYHGDVSTSWSMGWKVNWCVKLQDYNFGCTWDSTL